MRQSSKRPELRMFTEAGGKLHRERDEILRPPLNFRTDLIHPTGNQVSLAWVWEAVGDAWRPVLIRVTVQPTLFLEPEMQDVYRDCLRVVRALLLANGHNPQILVDGELWDPEEVGVVLDEEASNGDPAASEGPSASNHIGRTGRFD